MNNARTAAATIQWVGAQGGVTDRKIVERYGTAIIHKMMPDCVNVTETEGLGGGFGLVGGYPGDQPRDATTDQVELVAGLDRRMQGFFFLVQAGDDRKVTTFARENPVLDLAQVSG